MDDCQCQMFDKTLAVDKLTHESQLPQTDPSKTHKVKQKML